MKKGVFITLEGGEGTGKSTQIELLKENLSKEGIDVVITREPGGTDQADRIRALLLQGDSGVFDPMTEALLLFAARREHLIKKIWPALQKGQWVISDRFADSTRAFQGYGMGLNLNTIEKLYELVAGKFQPNLTFIFDIKPEVGIERSMKRLSRVLKVTREDRYERMGLKFHRKLRKGFKEIARQDPKRCVIIDASRSIKEIQGEILTNIHERLSVEIKRQKRRFENKKVVGKLSLQRKRKRA